MLTKLEPLRQWQIRHFGGRHFSLRITTVWTEEHVLTLKNLTHSEALQYADIANSKFHNVVISYNDKMMYFWITSYTPRKYKVKRMVRKTERTFIPKHNGIFQYRRMVYMWRDEMKWLFSITSKKETDK